MKFIYKNLALVHVLIFFKRLTCDVIASVACVSRLIQKKIRLVQFIRQIIINKKKDNNRCHPAVPSIAFGDGWERSVRIQVSLSSLSLLLKIVKKIPGPACFAYNDVGGSFFSYLKCLLIVITFSFSSLCALPVRVLLQEHKNPQWHLQSNEGFQFQDPKTGKKVCFGVSYFTVAITHQKGFLYINGKKIKQKSLYVIPNKKYVQFGSGTFDGCMLLQKNAKNCYLINLIDSEEYIFSVLKTESWPTWPVEMNKVQAIASRSYLLHQILHSRKTDSPYHIKNTNYHQTYTGVHERHSVRVAVKETEGIILSFNKEPILAMFDSCCGGIIPSKSKDLLDFSKAPYLARPYGCSYCKKSKIFSWKAEYSYSEFRDVLQEGCDGILHDLSDVKIGAKDKAGVVKHIIAKTKKDEISFSAKEMYKLFKEVKSYSFTVTKKSQTITLQGKGYGHHLGLCQWGAREMVARGWDYEKILQFYYPGTTVMKLNG